ncbi:MAG: PH domain-containing protein [Thermoguttaceae bacterium]|nr:PH domain-containing protein [Thermoguttaceae bacterium]
MPQEEIPSDVNESAVSDAKPSDSVLEPAWTGCRYSMKAFRFKAICLLILSVVLPAMAAYLVRSAGQEKYRLWLYGGTAALLVVLWAALLAKMIYRHYTISYKLDRDHLLLTRGFFRQTTDTILIPQIDDISKVQTLVDRLVNRVGTIEIYANDRSGGHILLEAVDDPHKAFESIDLLRKEYIRRRGIKPFVSYDQGVDVGDAGLHLE